MANVDWSRYGIPFALIFGMIGFIYHFIRDPKRAFAVFILFILTGVFIILYLNQYDPQPRERDYSYVGSFFTFSISTSKPIVLKPSSENRIEKLEELIPQIKEQYLPVKI